MRARKTPMPKRPNSFHEDGFTQNNPAVGGVLAPVPGPDGDFDMDNFNFTPAHGAHTDLGAETHEAPEEMLNEVESVKLGTTRMVELGMEVEEIERYR
jgi:hypothetical protein